MMFMANKCMEVDLGAIDAAIYGRNDLKRFKGFEAIANIYLSCRC